MENAVSIKGSNVASNQSIRALMNLGSAPLASTKTNPNFKFLAAEGADSFIDYLEFLGLGNDPNFLVLSSIYHYYYDKEEMKNITTVVNLKELNQIKDLKRFLQSVYLLLPPKSNIVGCFVDNENNNVFDLKEKVNAYQKKRILEAIENGIMSRVPFLNRMYSMLDAKTNNFMSRKNVTSLMNSNGFKIVDLTELNGYIFFCAQRQYVSGN
jgi:hypothetical protein